MVTDDGMLFDTGTGAQLEQHGEHSVDVRATAMRRTRNSFRVHAAPTVPMSTVRYRPSPNIEPAPEDVRHIADFFEGAPDGRERFRWTLRDSLDELLDGQRTGRWCYQHLMKTEKTYLGTAIEINLTREFEVVEGDDLDWRIADTEVDCKFSRDMGGWEIPMEMYICADHEGRSAAENHPALLVWFHDDTSEWAAGLLRITDDRLRWKNDKSGRAYNRDNKRKIASDAFQEIYWLWGGVQRDLPPNLFLQLPAVTREKILRPKSSGQGRLDDLFRYVQDRLIERQVVLTTGQQDDAPKRVRDTRHRLRAKGIIVLGHETPHQQIALSLGLPMPRKGSWVSTRVAPAADATQGGFFLEGQWWKRASASEPVVAAPEFPKSWMGLETRTGIVV